MRHRFQLDTAMRFLGIKLPNQPALCCVQSSLGELELRWGMPGLGHRWEVPPLASLASSHLSRCSPEHPTWEAPSASSTCRNHLFCPRSPPTFAWSALLPEDASFIVSVSSSGVPQAEDGVAPLWALAPLLDQKLPEDRSVATFLIAAPLAPSTMGPGPKVFSVRRNDGTCLVSRCESVHTDMCVCVFYFVYIQRKIILLGYNEWYEITAFVG